ncbi:MAG: hypothetical protein V7607_4928 [Solirubrobacteraceae bacterium]
MDEHDRRAPLQLLEDRIETGVSQVAAASVGEYRHAVELEDVEGVGDLLERPFDVRQGERRKGPEPVRTVASDVGEELVHPPRKDPPRRIVAEVHAWRADRRDRGIDTCIVEVRDRTVDAPARGRDPSRGVPVLIRGVPVEVGNDVVVKVDGAAHAGAYAAACCCSAPPRFPSTPSWPRITVPDG